MIFQTTSVQIADNSGPNKVTCLKVKKKKTGYLADIIIVVIKKKFLKKKKIKKRILRSIIINTKYKKKRLNGTHITFQKNKGLLLNQNLTFLGSNVKAILCREIKMFKKQFKKIISYSSGNI